MARRDVGRASSLGLWHDAAVRTLAILSSLLCACTSDPTLAVNVRSDLAASDVTATRVRVFDPDGRMVLERNVAVETDDELLGGVRALPQHTFSAGPYSVRAELRDGVEVVVGRTYAITLRAPFVLEAVLTRRCLGVVCMPPTPECDRGVCVGSGCGPEHPELCPPPECTSAADCGNLCPTPSCSDGACLIASGAVECMAGERCGPSGCTTEPLPIDAGTSMDAGGTPECSTNADCGGTQYGGWSGCDWPSQCAQSAPDEERSMTIHTCEAGRCRTSNGTDTRRCARDTNGETCGATTTGDWSACMVGGQCATSGTQTQDVTDRVCRNGSCASETRTASQGCTVDPIGDPCDDGDDCTQNDTCRTGGTCRGMPDCRPIACTGGCTPVCAGSCLDYCECF